MDAVEHEICNNCKKEIPQRNYVMHTMHCARNITLCKTCMEPFPKAEYPQHESSCKPKPLPKPLPPPTNLEKSSYFQARKYIEDKKAEARKERYMQKMERLVDSGHSLRETSTSQQNSYQGSGIARKMETPIKSEVTHNENTGAKKKTETKPSGMLACKFCDLDLPKLELEEHENYCGSRTDKCLECGKLVMYKDKQSHMDSNHSYLKKKGQNAPSSWDSATERAETVDLDSPRRRPHFRAFAEFDYDPMAYLPSAYQAPAGVKKKEGESYKEISRRLDCPAPPPPSSYLRRRNPPTELVIPCEFCGVPVPHEDLIEHETGCRPDLARFTPRRRAPSPDEDDYLAGTDAPVAAPATSDEELPCEFCGDMIPASQLWTHQIRCT